MKKPFARFGFTESKRYYHINLSPNSGDFVPVIEGLKRETVERSPDMVAELASRSMLAIFVALGTVHLVVLVYVFVRRRTSNADAVGGTARNGVGGSDSADEWTVQCSECGAWNEPGFRYCRQCVTELPGSDSSGLTSRDEDGQQS